MTTDIKQRPATPREAANAIALMRGSLTAKSNERPARSKETAERMADLEEQKMIERLSGGDVLGTLSAQKNANNKNGAKKVYNGDW